MMNSGAAIAGTDNRPFSISGRAMSIPQLDQVCAPIMRREIDRVNDLSLQYN